MKEYLGPTKLFIRYTLGKITQTTDMFEAKDLAKQVKDLKSQGVTNLTIHYSLRPPPDHTT